MFRKKKKYTHENFIHDHMQDMGVCQVFSMAWFNVPLDCRDDYGKLSHEDRLEIIRYARKRAPINREIFHQRYATHNIDDYSVITSMYKGIGMNEDWERLSERDRQQVVSDVKRAIAKTWASSY